MEKPEHLLSYLDWEQQYRRKSDKRKKRVFVANNEKPSLRLGVSQKQLNDFLKEWREKNL